MQNYGENVMMDAENCISSNEDGATKRKGIFQAIVDDLPPEVLAEIFRKLPSSDLLLCRLVNRKWNEISSYCMRQRADIEIVLPFPNDPEKQQPGRNVPNSKDFKDLIECFDKSTHFPFASFRFKDTEQNDNMERFLSAWGANIYELGVKIVVPNDVVMLRSLLTEKAPNLRKLHIHFAHELSEKQDIRLFDDSKEVQLLKLKVFTVLKMSEKDFGMVGDILSIAPNLNSFNSVSENSYDKQLSTESFTFKEFTLLQSLNKLHCLKNVCLSLDEKFIAFVEESPEFFKLKFESISLGLNKIYEPYSSQDAEMLTKLFEASKNSLVELVISTVGSIHGVKLDKFENVEKLTLIHDAHDGRWMFPPQFDMTKSFQNLRELTVDMIDILEDDYFSTYQPSGVMPNVEFLKILGDCRYDEMLMKMTPNVKTLVFDGEEEELPTTNFNAIISHLTKLENLKYILYVLSPDDLYSSCELDAMLTGIPEKYCKMLAVKLQNKDALTEEEIDAYDTVRYHFSILDVTGLKRLDIKIKVIEPSEGDSDYEGRMVVSDDEGKICDKAVFQPGSTFYKSGLTKVTKLLATDLMPNLKTKIQMFRF